MAVFASRGLLPTASNATAIISDARMARAAAKCSRLCAAKKSATMTRTPAGRADRRREDHVCDGTRRALQMSRTAPVRVRNGRVLLAMGGTIAAPCLDHRRVDCEGPLSLKQATEPRKNWRSSRLDRASYWIRIPRAAEGARSTNHNPRPGSSRSDSRFRAAGLDATACCAGCRESSGTGRELCPRWLRRMDGRGVYRMCQIIPS